MDLKGLAKGGGMDAIKGLLGPLIDKLPGPLKELANKLLEKLGGAGGGAGGKGAQESQAGAAAAQGQSSGENQFGEFAKYAQQLQKMFRG